MNLLQGFCHQICNRRSSGFQSSGIFLMVVLLFGPAVVSTGGPDWPLPVTWRSRNGFMRYPGNIA